MSTRLRTVQEARNYRFGMRERDAASGGPMRFVQGRGRINFEKFPSARPVTRNKER